MPMLVRTPEQIFRAEKKDLYVIRSNEKYERDAPGLLMIQRWIDENLPGTSMELLAPSEYSGVIAGGIGRMVRVDFNPDGLQKFCDRWEKDEASVDKRFQCYIYPYDDWYREHGCFVPTRDKPQGVGLTVWWHTPLGFIHHQLAERDSAGKFTHPANANDLWFSALALWPQLAAIDTDGLTSGRVVPGKEGWWVPYRPPLLSDNAPGQPIPTPEQIRDWFNLPPDAPVEVEDF